MGALLARGIGLRAGPPLGPDLAMTALIAVNFAQRWRGKIPIPPICSLSVGRSSEFVRFFQARDEQAFIPLAMFPFVATCAKESMMSAEPEIQDASEQFYSALGQMLAGDAGPLSDICSHSEQISTMHPIGGRELGWAAVKSAWEQVAKLAKGGQVKLFDQVIRVYGEVAYELGQERGSMDVGDNQIAIDWRVTNIYIREAGAWKLVHHHTDRSEPMIDIVRSLR